MSTHEHTGEQGLCDPVYKYCYLNWINCRLVTLMVIGSNPNPMDITIPPCVTLQVRHFVCMHPLSGQLSRECVCTEAVYLYWVIRAHPPPFWSAYQGKCARHPLLQSVHQGICAHPPTPWNLCAPTHLLSGLYTRGLVPKNDPVHRYPGVLTGLMTLVPFSDKRNTPPPCGSPAPETKNFGRDFT